MANFIPQLEFGPDSDLVVIFDSPPEGDPQNEALGTEKEQVRSVGGQLFTSEFYDFTTYNLRFILQSEAVAQKLKRLFRDYALKGQSFNYYPHSDEPTSFSVELEDESVTFKRDYPDGQRGFLWSFEFTLVSVAKTAPRIIRSTRSIPPAPQEAPAAVEALQLKANGITTATISWEPPEDTGTSPLREYNVRLGTTGQLQQVALGAGDGEVAHSLANLAASTNYTLFVRAVNTQGLAGPWASIGITTLAQTATISAVRNLRVSDVSTTELGFDWDVPIYNGGSAIASYRVDLVDSQGTDHGMTVTTTEASFTGLSPSTTYNYQVRATNADGQDGPWTSGTIQTASIVPQAPQAPQNVVLRLPRSDVENRRNLYVTFDWPGGSNAESVTQFKVYCYLKGTSVEMQEANVRTLDAAGITDRTGLDSITNLVIPTTRHGDQTYLAYIVAVNTSGDSVRSNVAELILPRTFSRDFLGNKRSRTGRYVLSDDYGDQDSNYLEDNDFGFDLSTTSSWAGSETYEVHTPTRLGALGTFALETIAPSLTQLSRIVIGGHFKIGDSSSIVTRLMLLQRRSTDPFWFQPYNVIKSSGNIYGLTPYKVGNETHYIYLKWGDATVRITQQESNFGDSVSSFEMTHATSDSHYHNSGCCVVNNNLYVFDFNDSKVYVYNLLTRKRDESLEIDLPQYIYPVSPWTDGYYIWFLGSSKFRFNQVIRDRMYCINVITKSRVSARRFSLVGSSEVAGINFFGLMAYNEAFLSIINSTGGADYLMRAWKL